LIKVTVLYPNEADKRFDMDYYMNTHIPMVQRLLAPAMTKITVEKGIAGGAPGTQAAFSVVAELYFDSIDSFGIAFAPVGAQIEGDIAVYTDIKPVIQINEVVLG
jgi:uncharacterized protein (TIGR02118 family)